MLDSRAARGIHSGHRGNFGKPIQEGVPWDAAKREGHAAPPHKGTSRRMPESQNSWLSPYATILIQFISTSGHDSEFIFLENDIKFELKFNELKTI